MPMNNTEVSNLFLRARYRDAATGRIDIKRITAENILFDASDIKIPVIKPTRTVATKI
jgi:hypothetical protein